MIDSRNRLLKLLRQCQTYQEFLSKTVSQSSWVLRPYVLAGEIVTKAWLEQFWNLNKGR
jgi:hypothetical protein